MTASIKPDVFIQGFTGHEGGPNGTITRVVIHATVSPCEPGDARNVAAYFQSPNSGGLAHYVVDPTEVVGCAPLDRWVWHAPPNPGSIGVELCDPQTGADSRWADDNHVAMLNRAASLVAGLCVHYSLPIVHLSAADLLVGKHGITGHAEVSGAWHQSDHTDPGSGFPWSAFIALVKKAAAPAPSDPNPWHPNRLIQITGHPQVWQMRLRNGSELVKAPVPDPDALAAAKASGQTMQTLIDNTANNAKVAAIPVVPWS